MCFKRSGAYFQFLASYTSLSPHAPSQLARTQFAYQLMRCKPIEQPGLKYPCWQFQYSVLFSHTFFFLIPFSIFSSHSPTLTLFPSLSTFSALSLFPLTPLQIEPRPLEILYQWTWSSRRSSGRRNTKRKRRRTGQWRRPFKDWKLSWTAGGTVMPMLILCWQLF